MPSSVAASIAPTARPTAVEPAPAAVSPTDTVNGTLNDSGHLPGALQPLEVAGTSRAARRETTGGNLDPIDPVARDAGEDDPAEAVLLGSPPTLVGHAVDTGSTCGGPQRPAAWCTADGAT
ncbi:hypothetical protein H310_14547 [Aphanomyces invadans]|uniref:Uncharacterized protein n=1 Tax=Aphanomyces invadans TaxID=157072 RepID=A0A024TBG9_9STRA|nr:hypothetical protein H310_14547 [Aphanomyces invadans]ETV90707.1 hypothetical protein H310_14547 [Aphanomyces invadans]|eukprot:XP_008880647.1 hypothetical protein H310_14547 [Aphanomyces invadans]